MPHLDGISPIVPVRDVAATISFYTDILGFELRGRSPDGGFGLVARDEAGVSLVLAADDAALAATRNNISAYIWVQDIKSLWSALEPRLATLPKGRVREPFEQSYGMREFHVKDPDGFLIIFGEQTERTGES